MNKALSMVWKMRWLVVLTLLIQLFSMGCGNYSQFKVQRLDTVTTQSKAISAIESIGLEVDSSDDLSVTTVPIRKYIGDRPNTIEYQVWLKIDIHLGYIEVYCTERKVFDSFGREGVWWFNKCDNYEVLKQIDHKLDVLDYKLRSNS